jgi:type IV secretory pathway VirB10-like protein
MKKQIAKEDTAGTGGPTTPPEQQQQQQADAEANPPVDNTQDDAANESLTPQLDFEVEKYSSLLNKR